MMDWPEHIQARTCHRRRGEIANTFTYGVDYVLIDPKSSDGPALFSRQSFNLFAVVDKDHGGLPGQGMGVAWAEGIFQDNGVQTCQTLLLTQPKSIGYTFNPVSFWLGLQKGELIAVIAEVNNTYGDRHSYFCVKADRSAFTPNDTVHAEKLMHVSPFQEVKGTYRFNFDVTDQAVSIRIDFQNGGQGLVATLAGKREAMSNGSIVKSVLRRPIGALRTITLIHWQALILKLKGAAFRARPIPPSKEVS